jgi:uncharacterized cupin superfamily protein
MQLKTQRTYPLGIQEFITIFCGEIKISVNGVEYLLKEGNSLRFKADCQHDYKNIMKEICKLSMVIYYPI